MHSIFPELLALPETPYLSLSSLSFERDDIPLFEGVSADLYPGNILQVEGPNGAGKTTLLRIISTALTPSSGCLYWTGQPVNSRRYEYLADLLFMGHAPAIKASLTAEENLNWWRKLNGGKSSQSNGEVLEAIGLRGYEDVPCYSLSAGQQRRVALARMLVSSATIWVLDEPFTAIDKAGVKFLESLMLSHVDAGGMIILSTHQSLQLDNYQRLNLADFCLGDVHG